MIITKKGYLTRKVMLSVFLPGVFSVLLINGCGERELLPVSSNDDTFYTGEESQTAQFSEASPDAGRETESETAYWYVHVCGAVESPGVYLLPEGSRCFEAIEMAGGLREDARSEALNLAAVLQDGLKLRVPTLEETKDLSVEEAEQLAYGYGTQDFSEAGGENGLVNINTADAALLCTLPGIGETRARQIIAYRESHGNFSSCEDIMNVTGIKAGLYEQIKDLICV